MEDVAVNMGAVLSRRLELRGGRELETAGCSGCVADQTYPPGHWRFAMCSTCRRLVVADEHVHTTETFLYIKGQIQQAAYACLDLKTEEGYKTTKSE